MAQSIRSIHFAQIVAVLTSLASAVGGAQTPASPAAVEWRTGSARELQLRSEIGVTWDETPLRRAVTNLSHNRRIAILLDRRIDPDRKIRFAVDGVSLETAMRTLAAEQRMGMCHVGPVVYFGPPETAEKLATIAAMRRQEVGELPRDARLRLGKTYPWEWNELATPRELVEHLAGQYAVEIVGSEKVPHDLWPSASLPALGFADRLTLILAGFDVTFEFNKSGDAVRLVPMPIRPVIETRYSTGTRTSALAARLEELFPRSDIQVEGDTLLVRATFEQQDQIGRVIKGLPVRRPVTPPPREGKRPPANQRYDLTIQDREVGPLMQTLARQLGLEISIDPAVAAEDLKKLVGFHVKKATLDELLDAALDPAGLSYRIEGNRLTIVPGNR